MKNECKIGKWEGKFYYSSIHNVQINFDEKINYMISFISRSCDNFKSDFAKNLKEKSTISEKQLELLTRLHAQEQSNYLPSKNDFGHNITDDEITSFNLKI